MKKRIFALAIVLSCVMAAGCSTSKENSPANSDSAQENSSASSEVQTGDDTSSVESTPAEKAKKLLNTVEFPSMVEVVPDKLNVYFGIEPEDVTDYSAYICGSGAAPDEFGIFIAKDEETAAKIRDALQSRIDDQHETFESYTPDAMYRFDDCFDEINGNTVIYAICADNSTAKEILS